MNVFLWTNIHVNKQQTYKGVVRILTKCVGEILEGKTNFPILDLTISMVMSRIDFEKFVSKNLSKLLPKNLLDCVFWGRGG